MLVALVCSSCSSPAARSDLSAVLAPPAGDAAAITLFLVRHAEPIHPPPEDAPRDPRLNAMGQNRADALARLLESAGIERVLSSDYHRTRETAAPIAEALGLDVELYDPGNLTDLAEVLLATPGRTLVAGHSNTTPELVGLLGGEPGEPIDEGMEFDRLYILTGSREAGISTVVLRYGAPVPEDWKERAAERREGSGGEPDP